MARINANNAIQNALFKIPLFIMFLCTSVSSWQELPPGAEQHMSEHVMNPELRTIAHRHLLSVSGKAANYKQRQGFWLNKIRAGCQF